MMAQKHSRAAAAGSGWKSPGDATEIPRRCAGTQQAWPRTGRRKIAAASTPGSPAAWARTALVAWLLLGLATPVRLLTVPRVAA